MSFFEGNLLRSLFPFLIVTVSFLFPGSVFGNGFVKPHNVIDAWEIDPDSSLGFGKTPVHEKCLAFFKDYIRYAGEFSRCELKYAVPFRMCDMCVEKYFITASTYNDLVTDNDLAECRVKLMKSDRVQIFPIVERNMENTWSEADCGGCFENLSINHTTKKVSYEKPATVTKFLELYNNLSICMNSSLEALIYPAGTDNQDVDVCSVCLGNYSALNEHYNALDEHYNGDVCMDIVDRMNYTRIVWSNHFNCSCRPNEPAAVIVITLIVAVTPIFFYILVRVTGKEKKNKLLKQKRLNLSGRNSNSHSNSIYQSLWRPNNYRNYHSLAET